MLNFCLQIVAVFALLGSGYGFFTGDLINIIWPYRCCEAGHPGEEEICYNRNYPFTHLPLPNCGEDLDIWMILYTRSDPVVGQRVTRNSIPRNFDTSKLTIFWSHGWLGSNDDTYLLKLRDEVVANTDLNFILVGWSGGAETPNYAQAAADTRPVGTEIGLAAETLIRQAGADREKIYCVGHSLGAHVCGHAGHRMKFSKIIGLDPAGPLFAEVDWKVGINPSVADRVDIWHTNGMGSLLLNEGTMKLLGHVDFFPNKGGPQAECVLNPSLPDVMDLSGKSPFTDVNIFTTGGDWLIGFCSHLSAVRFFQESLKESCFLAYHHCTDQYNLPGSCTKYDQPVSVMGLDSNHYPMMGIFYLETNEKPPYCQH